MQSLYQQTLCSVQSLYQQTDALTGGWLSSAAALMAACSAHLGSMVAARATEPSLAQLLAPPGSSAATGGGSSGDSSRPAPRPLRVVHAAVSTGQLIPSMVKVPSHAACTPLACGLPAVASALARPVQTCPSHSISHP